MYNLFLLLGSLFIAVALIGGGFEVSGIKVPLVNKNGRLLSFIGGVVFISLGIFKPIHTEDPTDNITKKVEWFTSAQYQQEFEKLSKDGFYPNILEGKCEKKSEYFHVEWLPIPLGVGSHISVHGLTKDEYENNNNKNILDGYSLESFSNFKDCSGVERYQATWFTKLQKLSN